MASHRLIEFSFRSRLAPQSPAELVLLARRSWRANLRAGITGAMRLKADRIDQTLEGPRDAVLALAARILTDRRHAEIAVRAFGPIGGRRFADWRVEGFEGLDADDPPGAAPRAPFDTAARQAAAAAALAALGAARPAQVLRVGPRPRS